jgi:apolipoprotein D and lipocalin family protein
LLCFYAFHDSFNAQLRIAMKFPAIALAAAIGWSVAAAQTPESSAVAQSSAPLITIPVLDAPRYMGTWYEIAKYPNWFQKKCVAETRAHYKLQADGSVQVVNRCRKDTGEIDEAVGEARQIGVASSPKLQVRFAPSWLSLLPFVWGNYWVIDLDDGYQLAAVSEPKREYLWVLSRTPTVSAQSYDALLVRLKAQGFDLGRLELTRQGK